MIPVAVGQRTVTAVGGLADSGLMLRLTRGRLWILLVGILLIGIVAVNVLSLSFSASASRTARQADAFEREISVLRGALATDVSSGEVEARAQDLGLIVPQPGEIRYLDPASDDAAVAAQRIRNGEVSAP
jgi:hypothetical protein